MAGLLDFVNSPAGMGLLSAVAGGMAGARKGTPWNNVGRGLVTGVAGYQSAQDQIRQEQENAFQKQFRQMQMDEMQRKITEQQTRKEAAKAAYGQAYTQPKAAVAPSTTYLPQLGGNNSLMPELNAALEGNFDQSPMMSPQSAVELPGQEAQAGGLNPEAYRQAMYNQLAQGGMVEDAMQYAPKAAKWTVVERYNENTGMPEKVLMDENNPSDIRAFGGAQADTVVADNLGGQLVYRGSRSATPLGTLDKTVSPDASLSAATSRRGQDISNANAAAARAVAIRGQDKSTAVSSRNGSMNGWKYDAGSDEWVAPPSAEYPQGFRSGSKAKTDAVQSMQYVINQFRGGKDSKGNKLPGVIDKTTTGGIMGVSGLAGKVFDSQDAMRFDNLKEQMSTELRTLFRIPGEGALSDKEQAQYGIQLPSVKYNKATNEAILKDIENRINIRNNMKANPFAPKNADPLGIR